MSSLEPLTLYSHAGGPNPWKVAIILEELSLPYETVTPAPSGIIDYFIDQYDTTRKLSLQIRS
ncbi:hypothetical protein E4U59_005155 [Claviceps monticola]|nr:hypothetical protein E4U59_005155 [Claviceps monticola]